MFRPCLAPCDRRPVAPEGTTVIDRGGSGESPEGGRLGRIPDGPRRGCQWICPEERSTASVRIPEGIRFPTSSRRISEETRSRPSARSEERRPVVRAPSLRPSAVARVHDGETARRGLSHPEVCQYARHSRAPAKDAASNPSPPPRRAMATSEPEAPPGGGPLAARDSGKLQQAGAPAQGQTVVVFTGTAETRSEDEVSPPIRRSE